MKHYILGLCACSLLLSASCRKKDDPVNPAPTNTDTSAAKKGPVTFKLENYAGSEQLVLNTKNYVNAHGDTFNVTLYSYFISNIVLKTDDGKTFKETESYHLVRETEPGSKTFTINDLPAGNYTSISFLIGVDSTRNVSGAQTGALDPGTGMFWTWNTGYIMAKIEGTSPQAVTSSGSVIFHIGGFSGAYNVLRTVTLNLPQKAVTGTGKSPVITLRSDLLEWFKTPYVIDFTTTSSAMNPGKTLASIADNYADMFSITKVENP